MTKPEPRLQSPAVQAAMSDLADLQGQVLADAAFRRKVAGLMRRAQREILGSFGKAIEAFSGEWEALHARQRAERERFVRREASLAGRLVNAVRGMPWSSLGEAVAHLRTGLASAGARERALLQAHGAERNDIALRQRRYRQSLSKPHEEALELLRVKSEKAPRAVVKGPALLREVSLKAARLRIAAEIGSSVEPRPGSELKGLQSGRSLGIKKDGREMD